jgi:starch synthase
MTAFIPLYIRHFFADDPHFENAKLVFSVYDDKSQPLDKDMARKLTMEGFKPELLKDLKKPTTDDLYKFGMDLSDAVVKGSAKLSRSLENAFKDADKPSLGHVADADLVKAHGEFYQEVLEEALV